MTESHPQRGEPARKGAVCGDPCWVTTNSREHELARLRPAVHASDACAVLQARSRPEPGSAQLSSNRAGGVVRVVDVHVVVLRVAENVSTAQQGLHTAGRCALGRRREWDHDRPGDAGGTVVDVRGDGRGDVASPRGCSRPVPWTPGSGAWRFPEPSTSAGAVSSAPLNVVLSCFPPPAAAAEEVTAREDTPIATAQSRMRGRRCMTYSFEEGASMQRDTTPARVS